MQVAWAERSRVAEHNVPRLVPPVSKSTKSTAPLGVAPPLLRIAVIENDVPGRTVPDGPPDWVIVGVKRACAALHQKIANSQIAADRNDPIADVRMVSQPGRTVPIRMRLFTSGWFSRRLGGVYSVDGTRSARDCNAENSALSRPAPGACAAVAIVVRLAKCCPGGASESSTVPGISIFTIGSRDQPNSRRSCALAARPYSVFTRQ